MIALVSGTVAVRRSDHVIVDCGGVGYRLSVSSETLRQVPAVGNSVMLHTHLIPRDDALTLYGFATEDERDLFLMLLGVQSVGPKVALEVLSGGSVRLQAVKGVGKRTAERIVVELREKVGVSVPEQTIRATRSNDPRSIAREGLIGLGYSPQEVESLLDGLVGETPEELISEALRAARQ